MDKAGIEVGDIVHNKFTDKYYLVLQIEHGSAIVLNLDSGDKVEPSLRALRTNYEVVA